MTRRRERLSERLTELCRASEAQPDRLELLEALVRETIRAGVKEEQLSLPEALEQLGSRDSQRRLVAARALVAFGPAGFPGLVERLEGAGPELCQGARFVLERLGPEFAARAEPLLPRMIAVCGALPRDEARDWLEGLAPATASRVGVLERAWRSGGRAARLGVLRAFRDWQLSPRDAATAELQRVLVAALPELDRGLRFALARALNRPGFTTRELEDVLWDAVESDDPGLAVPAIETLMRDEAHHARLIPKLLDGSRRRALAPERLAGLLLGVRVEVLRDRLEELLELAGRIRRPPRRFIALLGELDPTGEALLRLLDERLTGAPGQDLVELGAMLCPVAVPRLLDCLDRHEALALDALAALRRAGPAAREAAPELRARLTDSGSTTPRRAGAVFAALVAVDEPAEVAALIRAQVHAGRLELLESLTSRPPDGLEALADAAEDPLRERLRALQAVAAAGGDGAGGDGAGGADPGLALRVLTLLGRLGRCDRLPETIAGHAPADPALIRRPDFLNFAEVFLDDRQVVDALSAICLDSGDRRRSRALALLSHGDPKRAAELALTLARGPLDDPGIVWWLLHALERHPRGDPEGLLVLARALSGERNAPVVEALVRVARGGPWHEAVLAELDALDDEPVDGSSVPEPDLALLLARLRLRGTVGQADVKPVTRALENGDLPVLIQVFDALGELDRPGALDPILADLMALEDRLDARREGLRGRLRRLLGSRRTPG